MQTTSNLVEATANKIEERIRKIIKLRKNIISNTNNFREFKIVKSEIIHQLVEYENDFRQLNTIIKSITTQNIIQKENADLHVKQLERNENNLKILEKENFQIGESNQELQKRLANVVSSNCDKDSYINNLLTKIGYLENIIKDYQKKYEVIRISPETFVHNYPGPTDSYLSRYNEFSRNVKSNNDVNLNYKKELNLNYDYERDYFDLNNMKRNLNNTVDKNYLNKKEKNNFDATNVSTVNFQTKSINFINDNNFSENFDNASGYQNFSYKDSKNNVNENNLSSKNFVNDLDINKTVDINNKNNDFKKSILSNYTPHEKLLMQKNNFDTNNNYKNNHNNLKDNIEYIKITNYIDANETNTNKKSLNFTNEINEDKQNVKEYNSPIYINENNENTNKSLQIEFSKSNGGAFKKSSEQLNENNLNKSLNISEKDRANLVLDILLKIFSSDNINTTLKRKYGEDLQFKLTDKNVDALFLLEVEKDVKVLLNKEKEDKIPNITSNVNSNDNVNYKGIRKSIRTYSPEGKLIHMQNPYFKKKILQMDNNTIRSNKNKISINLNDLKYNPSFNRTCKSVEKNSKNDENRERSNSSNLRSIDLMKNTKLHGENGYSSLKDYFIKNSNYIKGLDKRKSSSNNNKI